MSSKEPKTKNKLFSRYGTLVLVGGVCVLLIAISAVGLLSRGNAQEEPDDGITMHTPEPTPNPESPSTPDDTPDDTPEPIPEPTPDPVLPHDPVNPLTGLPMDAELTRRRPMVISVSNERAAQPMNGISGADIVYEMPFEGNVTRMLFLYQDIAGIIKVGSIRSARHYTVHLAESYDGILIISGGVTGVAEARARGAPFLDESTRVQTRDLNRVPGRRVGNLHSLVTTTALLERNLPDYSERRGFRLMHEDDYNLGLVFIDDATPQNGDSVVDFEIKFGNAKSSFFSYDEANKTYGLSQFGSAVRDANDDSQAAFTNILILKTSISLIRQGPYAGAGRVDIVTTGSGEGYFINGGKYIEIDWHRATNSDPFNYTLKDGTALELGTGRTYIGIVSTRGGMEPG